MTKIDHLSASPEIAEPASLRVGMVSAIITALLTLVTFGFAITAIPISGANCLGECIEYPYLDTLAQYPKDYIWMYLAVIQVLAYVAFMVSIHACAPRPKAIYAQIGLAFGLMAALALAGNYFVQFSVVPVSLVNGETEGIPFLTQYNSHGVFIVLEELGYLLMALSFVFVAPAFAGRTRLEAAVRWIFIAGFLLAMAALAMVAASYGLERRDRFEVIVISIDWLVLLINGILVSRVYRRRMIPAPGR